ncbi:hypothetical protein CAEBREN_08309 [Caenorhabditis brenneri]|uniref:Uncharacterized protein n=1 Tax=Caenorhabditis brenneri TaxID=135651 RepID=G0MRT4_CAEBE|nr:hypothetical protein CAEBREN_08309 [Caenorhabditis brenneri]
MQVLLFVALFLVVTSKAADLTCPTGPISSKTPTGAFPATGISVFPANYNCSIEFDIPDGQVVEFVVETNVIPGSGDSLLIRDAVSTFYEMNSSVSLFYAPANNAKLYITTKTATSYFYFNWKYLDVTNYKRIQNPTGTILPMNLTQGSYYQFTSAKSRVAFHTGNLKNNLDLGLSQILVYDGEDLKAKYIGTLFQFLQTKTLSASTGNSLVLVNYYGTESWSYGIANDYSAVFSYDSYGFSILSKDIDYSEAFSVTDRFESAVTFYCIDSDETYITDLTMANRNNGGQAVRFKPRTPTEVYTNLLVYNTGDRIAQSLPQQIMTNIFTVTMYQCDLRLGFVSGPLFLWTTAAPGRQGMIYSPSNWNPTLPITPQYFTNITTKENAKFVFNIPFVLVKPGEKIRVEIGNPDGRKVFVEFNTTSIDTGTKAAYGTYMATTFTGTHSMGNSSFKMSFSVEGSVSVPTASPLVTTTKSSEGVFNCSVFLLLLVKLIV